MPLIEYDLVEKITKIFGTPNELFYEYLWIAQVGSVFKRDPIVSVVKKHSGEYRGLLLVSVMAQPWDREFGGPDPLGYIEFKDWNDQVHNLLKTGVVLSEAIGWVLDGTPYFLDLYIASENMLAKFNYNSDSRGDREKNNDKYKLKSAIIETILFLAKAYNHPEINECLAPPEVGDPEG